METISTVVAALNSLSPLGIIALLSYIIYLQVRSHAQVETIKTNDLHDVPEVIESLRRIELMLATEFSYIRSRLNNG